MNDRQEKALADAMEQYAIKRDSMGFVPNFSIEGKEKILQVAAALRSRTPSAPDVAMRHAVTSNSDVAEALTQAFEYFDDHSDVFDGDYGVPEPNREMRLAQLCKDGLDAWDALSASEAKAGEQSDQSQAKATEGKAGMAVVMDHVRRSTAGTGLLVGEAVAVQPATSEIMDVTAGETAPTPPQVDREAVARIVEGHLDSHTFEKNDDGSVVIDRAGMILTISEDERLALAPTAPAKEGE